MPTVATPSAAFLPELLPHQFGPAPTMPDWIVAMLTAAPMPRRPQETAHPAVISAGRWVCHHYRERAAESGTLAAARQLRKQGYPLEIALAVLTGRTQ